MKYEGLDEFTKLIMGMSAPAGIPVLKAKKGVVAKVAKVKKKGLFKRGQYVRVVYRKGQYIGRYVEPYPDEDGWHFVEFMSNSLLAKTKWIFPVSGLK